MLQMKLMAALTHAQTTSSSTIAVSTTEEEVAEPTAKNSFETSGTDLEEFRAFMATQHASSTLNISVRMEDFAENLISSLNAEADFTTDEGHTISLSRALNSLGVTLTPTQAEMMCFNLGIEYDEDLSPKDLATVLKSLGFQEGENSNYNLTYSTEKALKKITDTSKFKIQKYSSNGKADKQTMDSTEFEFMLDLFKEEAPDSAELNYGSLDTLSEQLLHAANAREKLKVEDAPTNGSNVSLDEVLNSLGFDAETMSEQEKKELMYKAGITTKNKDYDDSNNVIERSKVDTNTPDYTNKAGDLWAGIGSTVGVVVCLGGSVALAAAGPVGWAIAAGVVAVAALGYGIYKICETVSQDRRDKETQSLLNNANDTTTLNAGGEGIGLAANNRADNLSQDDIQKVLVALGFGEKSITKAEYNQALENDIQFTRANITDKNGENIFNNFLNNLSGRESNQTAINSLVNTILKSDDTVQQAAIEAFFSDFPDFVDEFFEKAIAQTADERDTNVPYNVMSIKLFFKGAQDLINATTDPDKKSKYKQLYNAGIMKLEQFTYSTCLTVGGVNLAACIASQMSYKTGDITDSASGYPS